MRALILVLLLANVAFFAWSYWIDTPLLAPASPKSRGLPPLVLAADADKARAAGEATAFAAKTNCLSVGPFDSEERAEGALAALRTRGYEPRQRSADGEHWDGYWVYVGDLKSDLDEARVMRTLIQAQLSDARIMPLSDEGRRISVGVFSDRARAERRQRLVQRLGIEAQIGERRSPGTVFWMDVDVKPGESTVPTEGLRPPEVEGPPLEEHACAAAA